MKLDLGKPVNLSEGGWSHWGLLAWDTCGLCFWHDITTSLENSLERTVGGLRNNLEGTLRRNHET